MSPYDVHESINKGFYSVINTILSRMGIAEDHTYSVEVDTNGRIECGLVIHVPDLMVTVNNVSDSKTNIRVHPVLLLETAFSQDRKVAIEKAVEDGTKPVSALSESRLAAIAAEPFLSEEDFGDLCKDCPAFGPVIVKGIPWIDVKSIRFEGFVRSKQGVFDFESSGSVVHGTLHPKISMSNIERVVAIGIRQIINLIIQVKMQSGIQGTEIQKLRDLDPSKFSSSIDWEAFHRKVKSRVVRSAYQRYSNWYRTQLKRKGSSTQGGGLAKKSKESSSRKSGNSKPKGKKRR
ncbi:hypothetical protein JVT61DRAFT_12320 [Boletus reticuloceps]|uniref:Uncharacterized protein n=1 Tax=Boletus reticuloceps TaxID=495285 RepID=A0A8I3A4C3_9AGAM|nr:hypothetical protein JVT61DRAFT_12320 [Boletus reticuloceps]